MVTVCTVLPPPERPRLDAAGDGCFTTLHTSSFRDALRAARRKRVDALVLSVHACRGDELPAVARFVREFPAIPALSVSDVAYRLDYSSPQSFGRHLKAMLGVTAGEFRRRFPFEVSLERYVDLLITPYRETLRAFCPLNAGLWDQGPNVTRVSRAG